MNASFDTVVFDLYGTLVDILTDETPAVLWRRMAWLLRSAGGVMPAEALRAAYLSRCAGAVSALEADLARRGVPGPCEIDILPVWQALAAQAGADLSPAGIRLLAWRFRVLSLRRLRLYPGAAEVLARLRRRRKRLILLSNAQAAFTRPELRQLGLAEAFDHVLLSSEAGVRKPSPAFFALLAEHGAVPERTLMVGNDDVCDCRAAARAGIDSLYIRTAQSPPRTGPLPPRCREIRRLTDVPVLAEIRPSR